MSYGETRIISNIFVELSSNSVIYSVCNYITISFRPFIHIIFSLGTF